MRRFILLVFLLVSPTVVASDDCIELLIEPGKMVEWDVWVATSPRFSMALDGYVIGPTRRDLKGPRLNLNHHEHVDRLSTSSTTEQMQIETKMGLWEAFTRQGKRVAILHLNDCDEDVCTVVKLARKPSLVWSSDPRVGSFFLANDRMDRTGGMYPLSGIELWGAREWVFQPYRDFKTSGGLDRRRATEYRAIIDEVGERIDAFLDGKMPDVRVGDGFVDLGGGKLPNGGRWRMVKEEGSGARVRLVREGVRAFVFVFPDGRYSIGRTSDWVPFPLELLYASLNAAEPAGLVTATNKWGGSDTIGGSPRLTNSRLSPADVERVINEFLATYRRDGH